MERILELAYGHAIDIASDSSQINIAIDPRVDTGVLTADDPSPMYVNLEVIRTGVSKTNRRYYNSDVVRQISEMIPGVMGYLGHPDPEKTHFEFREPQCVFVGSQIQEMENGIVRALAKAYIFTTSNLREWIPKSIAAGRPLTVSINGVGDVARDTVNNIIHVQSITQLDSIDWANPGTEGVGTAQALSVVSELQGGGDNMDPIVKTPEVIKSITIAEMRAHNIDVINEAIKGVSVAELQNINPDLVKIIQESAKVTEMALKVDGKDQMVKLADVQGVIDTKDQKIAELQSSINQAKITEYKGRKIAELVPEKYRDTIGKKVTGNTEAEIDASITSEIDFIKEIAGAGAWDNMPRGNNPRSGDDMLEAVKNLFGSNKTK